MRVLEVYVIHAGLVLLPKKCWYPLWFLIKVQVATLDFKIFTHPAEHKCNKLLSCAQERLQLTASLQGLLRWTSVLKGYLCPSYQVLGWPSLGGEEMLYWVQELWNWKNEHLIKKAGKEMQCSKSGSGPLFSVYVTDSNTGETGKTRVTDIFPVAFFTHYQPLRAHGHWSWFVQPSILLALGSLFFCDSPIIFEVI